MIIWIKLLYFVIGMAVGIVLFTKSAKRLVVKQDVMRCFKDVNWTKQTFTVGGAFIEDQNGNKHFYPCKEIDTAIKKINKLMEE